MVRRRVTHPRGSGRRGHVAARWGEATERLVRGGLRDLSVEGLHRLHRDVRRRALELAALGRWMRPADRPKAREVGRTLHRIARTAGRARDPDVYRALIARATAEVGESPTSTWGRFWMDEFGRRSRRKRAALRRRVRDAERSGELEELRNLGDALRASAGRRSGDAVWRRDVERVARRIRDALARARRRPSAKRLHRLRQALRQAGTLHDLAWSERPAVPPAIPADIVRLRARLGRFHDLDDLLSAATGHGPARRTSRVRRRLEHERGRLRARLMHSVRDVRTGRRLATWISVGRIRSATSPLPGIGTGTRGPSSRRPRRSYRSTRAARRTSRRPTRTPSAVGRARPRERRPAASDARARRSRRSVARSPA